MTMLPKSDAELEAMLRIAVDEERRRIASLLTDQVVTMAKIANQVRHGDYPK